MRLRVIAVLFNGLFLLFLSFRTNVAMDANYLSMDHDVDVQYSNDYFLCMGEGVIWENQEQWKRIG